MKLISFSRLYIFWY